MSSVAIRNNLSTFIDAILNGNTSEIEQTAREVISRAEDASELIGQIGLAAMHGDSDGHTILTLSAASMMCRWLIALRYVIGDDTTGMTMGIPLVMQALTAAAPAIRAGQQTSQSYPKAIFPGDLPAGETVATALNKAIFGHDPLTVERLLFGLYGTGADYRTISVRIYDGISQTFQQGGHVLQCAIRGSQVLDAVQWGEDAPHYLHWIAPQMALHSEEPAWIADVRTFLGDAQHSLASYRTRLAAPRNENALPLRALLLRDASTQQICQGVYDSLITNGASSQGVGSVIALAANDLLQEIDDDSHDLFLRAAHGLLTASATRLVYTQVQEVEALPLLFTTAASIHALYQELSATIAQTPNKAVHPNVFGGGLIAPALLEALHEQIAAKDIAGALATTRRYIQLSHEKPALFAMIGLGATHIDAGTDQGHSLQIIQAAGDEFMAWPAELNQTNIEGFLHTALRAAALG